MIKIISNIINLNSSDKNNKINNERDGGDLKAIKLLPVFIFKDTLLILIASFISIELLAARSFGGH